MKDKRQLLICKNLIKQQFMRSEILNKILDETPLRIRLKVTIMSSTVLLYTQEEIDSITPEEKEKMNKWANQLASTIVKIVKNTKPEMIQ